MRISDWSSDVCSSDLLMAKLGAKDDLELSEMLLQKALVAVVPGSAFGAAGHIRLSFATSDKVLQGSVESIKEIGRASCRYSVCQNVSISVVAVSSNKKNQEINAKHINQKTNTK